MWVFTFEVPDGTWGVSAGARRARDHPHLRMTR
jgi:hypothetical protein